MFSVSCKSSVNYICVPTSGVLTIGQMGHVPGAPWLHRPGQNKFFTTTRVPLFKYPFPTLVNLVGWFGKESIATTTFLTLIHKISSRTTQMSPFTIQIIEHFAHLCVCPRHQKGLIWLWFQQLCICSVIHVCAHSSVSVFMPSVCLQEDLIFLLRKLLHHLESLPAQTAHCLFRVTLTYIYIS